MLRVHAQLPTVRRRLILAGFAALVGAIVASVVPRPQGEEASGLLLIAIAFFAGLLSSWSP